MPYALPVREEARYLPCVLQRRRSPRYAHESPLPLILRTCVPYQFKTRIRKRTCVYPVVQVLKPCGLAYPRNHSVVCVLERYANKPRRVVVVGDERDGVRPSERPLRVSGRPLELVDRLRHQFNAVAVLDEVRKRTVRPPASLDPNLLLAYLDLAPEAFRIRLIAVLLAHLLEDDPVSLGELSAAVSAVPAFVVLELRQRVFVDRRKPYRHRR